ncbi:MAG: hypothetical protein MUP19_11720 [Candidatus Aminicenantes bacterium]|nr:hypothetical protein [Candidatus Aminicenantes bacterium]
MNDIHRKPQAMSRETRRRNVLSMPVLIGLLVLAATAGWGQTPAPPPLNPPSPPPSPLRVFLDAPGFDPMALIKGIPLAAPVPGPETAQVLVRIASHEVEAGIEFSLFFVGQHEFAGVDDVLKTVAAKGETPKAVDEALAKTIEFGLMRYAARTPLARRVRIALMDKVSPTAVSDPWHFWVFSLSANTFLWGETTYSSQMYYGSFSAQRVTEDLKVRLSVGAMLQKDRYDLPEFKYSSSLDSRNLRGLIVKSLDDHWSLGAGFTYYYSLFSNVKQGVEWMPGIEFNLFPYSQSTKKQLRLLYQAGLRSFKYIEETIYDKTKETLWGQSLTATLELVQPWGNISTSLEGFHYFHDLSMYRLELNSEISFRIFEGLNFNIEGGGSWIHNQLSLAKGGSAYEEVILRRKEQATTYSYFFMVGLSFSFGSIRSNIVNPRFGTSGSGGFSMQISM